MSQDMMQALSGSSLLSLSIGTLPAGKPGMNLDANPFASQLALMTGSDAAVAGMMAPSQVLPGTGEGGFAATMTDLVEATEAAAPATALASGSKPRVAPQPEAAPHVAPLTARDPRAVPSVVPVLPEEASATDMIEAALAGAATLAETSPASTAPLPVAKASDQTPELRVTARTPAVAAQPQPLAAAVQAKPATSAQVPNASPALQAQPEGAVQPVAQPDARPLAPVPLVAVSAPMPERVSPMLASEPAADAVADSLPVATDEAATKSETRPAVRPRQQAEIADPAIVAAMPMAAAAPAAVVQPEPLVTDLGTTRLAAEAAPDMPVQARRADEVSQPVTRTPAAPISTPVTLARPADLSAPTQLPVAASAVPVAMPESVADGRAQVEVDSARPAIVRSEASQAPSPARRARGTATGAGEPTPVQPVIGAVTPDMPVTAVDASAEPARAPTAVAATTSSAPARAPASAAAPSRPAQSEPLRSLSTGPLGRGLAVDTPMPTTTNVLHGEARQAPGSAPQPVADVDTPAAPAAMVSAASVADGRSQAPQVQPSAPAQSAAAPVQPAQAAAAPISMAAPVQAQAAAANAQPARVQAVPAQTASDEANPIGAPAPVHAQAAPVAAQPAPSASRTSINAATRRSIETATRSPRPADALANLFDKADPAVQAGLASVAVEPLAASASEAVPPAWAAALNAVTPQVQQTAAVSAPQGAGQAAQVPVHTLALDAGFVAGIESQITRLMDGGQMVKIQMMPEHLGRIDIEMLAGPERDQVRIVTEHDAVRDTLASSQHRLEQDLRSQGHRNTEVTVELRQQSTGSQNGSAQQQQQRGQSGTESTLAREGAQRANPSETASDAATAPRRPRGNVRYA